MWDFPIRSASCITGACPDRSVVRQSVRMHVSLCVWRRVVVVLLCTPHLQATPSPAVDPTLTVSGDAEFGAQAVEAEAIDVTYAVRQFCGDWADACPYAD